MRLGALLLVVLAFAASGARCAESLKADLSDHVVSITTGFTGTSLLLFGTRQEKGDIVIVVRGPPSRAVVRRRHHVLGFWINTERAVFEGVPSFYATISSRRLDDVAAPRVLAVNRIGIDNLHLALRPFQNLDQAREAAYRAALVRRQERSGRFVAETGEIAFIGDHLFRATIAFPSNVPVGAYSVEVFLMRDGAIVASETVPLSVTEAGVDSNVSQFAQSEALAYGLIAVAATAMAGWLASLPFRSR
ncbi:MAG TPA: TIGR02186 family protein [Stellaceae bacterium]|nr:TIGR02186 family protein [Stellaceae bacterium]